MVLMSYFNFGFIIIEIFFLGPNLSLPSYFVVITENKDDALVVLCHFRFVFEVDEVLLEKRAKAIFFSSCLI